MPLNHSILNIFIVVSSFFSRLCVWNRGISRNSIEKSWINQRITSFSGKKHYLCALHPFFFLSFENPERYHNFFALSHVTLDRIRSFCTSMSQESIGIVQYKEIEFSIRPDLGCTINKTSRKVILSNICVCECVSRLL